VLSREYGYFDEGRRIALLTATPEPRVRDLLERIGAKVAYLGAQDEPASAETTPSLAPTSVRVLPAGPEQGLDRLVPGEREMVGKHLAAGDQGAIISSALWRIGLIHAVLKRTRFGDRIGRITGPASLEERARASQSDLILATRTVDIGYNFGRLAKPRQSLDFLYFDATFDDEFLQRLGRAGRVLGRSVSDQPSDVTAVVSAPLYRALQPLDGQRLSRLALAAHLAADPGVARDRLFSYLESAALGEVMLPLHQLAKMTAVEQIEDVEKAFEAVRAVFAPGSRSTFAGLRRAIRRFDVLEQRHRDSNLRLPERVRLGLKGFLKDNGGGYDRVERGQIGQDILGRDGPLRGHFEAWWGAEAEQYACMAARFAFRDSFDEPAALVWDPDHYLSDEDTCRYGVLHLLENYWLRFDRTAVDWSKRSRLPSVKAPTYLTIERPRERDERLRTRFLLRPQDDFPCTSRMEEDGLPKDLEPTREQWIADRACQIRAFRGLRIELIQGQLPPWVTDLFTGQAVVGLAVPKNEGALAGRVWSTCWSAGFFPRELVVTAGRGRTIECLLLLGTPALQVAAELRGLLAGATRKASRQDGPIFA
jgi:CRISPR-associated endonuclease/helicase Cas3